MNDAVSEQQEGLSDIEIQRMKELNGKNHVVYNGVKYQVSFGSSDEIILNFTASPVGEATGFSVFYIIDLSKLMLSGFGMKVDLSFLKAFLQGYQIVPE